jgi:hypothetical protein
LKVNEERSKWVGHHYTIVEAISFGLGSSMPMGAHENRTTKHHCRNGKGTKIIISGYKVPTHSLNIQIIL